MTTRATGLARWGLPAFLVAALALWILIATSIFPEMLTRAYRGEGFTWLAPLMGNRGEIPLDAYLADLHANALRLSLILALFLALAVGWAARGRSATDPWLEPAPMRNLAIARIVVVGLQLVLLLWPGVHPSNLGADPGYQAFLAATPGDTFEPTASLRLLLPGIGRPGAALLRAVWWLAVAGGIAGLLGIGGRPPLLVLAWASTVLVAHQYSYGEYHHPEALHAIAMWIVAVSPATRALSIDRVRRRLRESRAAGRFIPVPAEWSAHARWPLTLIAMLFAVTYYDAAIEKLIASGSGWFDPATMAYHMAVDGTRHLKPLGVWLARNLEFLTPIAVGAWGIEFFFPVVLVFPLVAPLFVFAAMAMHVGIWVIHGPPFLQHIVLLPVPFQRRLGALWRRLAGSPDELRVLYDGHCDLCRRSVVLLETLDVGRRLRFVDLEDPEEASEVPDVDRSDALSWMHVADPEERLWRGFFAVRRIARHLPLLWPTLPVLYAPGSGSLGPLIYDVIARRRSRRGCRIDL